MDITEDLIASLDGYAGFDMAEEAGVAQLQQFLAAGGDIYSRAHPTGHVTASAMIVDQTMTKTLLTHHAKLNEWLQFGGHVDPEDETVLAAALREAFEESGLSNLQPHNENIFDIDVHAIPFHAKKDEAAHVHYDIRYLLIAPTGSFTITHESNDVRWFTLDEAAKVTVGNASIPRMIHKIQLMRAA